MIGLGMTFRWYTLPVRAVCMRYLVCGEALSRQVAIISASSWDTSPSSTCSPGNRGLIISYICLSCEGTVEGETLHHTPANLQ